MRTILVLTDFSTRAQYAAEYAIRLAIPLKANILLCHALEVSDQYPVADSQVLRNQTLKRLQEIGRHFQAFPGEDQPGMFHPSISYITDVNGLTDLAEKVIVNYSVDITVIGAHRSTGLSRFFFGSHTNDILDSINCPVLLIPENTTFKPVRHIAYATDLSFNNTKVISFLLKLAKPFASKISVNHISLLDLPPTAHEKETEDLILSQIRTSGVEMDYESLREDTVEDGLLHLSGSGNVDILSLVHKRYDFIDRIFHSSISKHLAHSTIIPLLVMPHSYSQNKNDLHVGSNLSV
ncbi:universal stress protein [Desertivirga xinjiangensis]|uniref:universal stress protein n=1 Tax=Desertivirga xinjiangensis TaxID=539206 RepID=UPI00210E69D1|nr:universal stress protein [Pedobacter xinjiangensis]